MKRIEFFLREFTAHWYARYWVWQQTRKLNGKEATQMFIKVAKVIFTVAVVLVACYILLQGYNEFAALVIG